MTVPTHAITGASGQPGRLAVQELLARSVPVSDVVGFADDAGEVHPSHRCLNDFGAGHARRRTGEETKVPRPIDDPPRRGVTICGTSRWEILRCNRQVRPASENDERVGTPPDRRWDSGSGSNGKPCCGADRFGRGSGCGSPRVNRWVAHRSNPDCARSSPDQAPSRRHGATANRYLFGDTGPQHRNAPGHRRFRQLPGCRLCVGAARLAAGKRSISAAPWRCESWRGPDPGVGHLRRGRSAAVKSP